MGGGDVGGVGDVDGDVEEGLRGGFDERDRGWSPDGGVLANSGGDAGEEATAVVAEDRHGRGGEAEVGMGVVERGKMGERREGNGHDFCKK